MTVPKLHSELLSIYAEIEEEIRRVTPVNSIEFVLDHNDFIPMVDYSIYADNLDEAQEIQTVIEIICSRYTQRAQNLLDFYTEGETYVSHSLHR